MLLSKGSVKLRSLALSPFVLALATGLAGATATGCFFFDGHDDHDSYDDVGTDADTAPPDDTSPPPVDVPETVSEVTIQPDQVMSAAGGEGVGIFVEYNTGGKWRIWTTCDTFTSKAICSYQIFASFTRIEHFKSYATEDVEGFDEVQVFEDGVVQFTAETDSDIDALVLEVEENQPIQLEVFIDGQNAQPFVYWVSDDIIHAGAPDNPVIFRPVATHL
jgi:hypothetical protein